MRIVSLLPSATEIVYALGLEGSLAGVTFECDHPPEARHDHAVVVGGADTAAMSPGEIDAYVRAQVAAGADLYHLDQDALAGLQPDVVLTQDLCRVCALPAGHVDEALAHLGCRAQVVTLDPYTLDDVLGTARTVAAACGVPERGAALVARLQARLDAVTAAVSGAPRPRVAMMEWVDPPFAAGHWIPDLITAAGGDPVGSRPGQRSVPVSWDDVRATDPDVVVVSPCGFGLDGAWGQALTVVAELPGVPVWAIDGNALVVRPGPRLVDGVEAVASVLHPGLVPPRPQAVRRVR